MKLSTLLASSLLLVSASALAHHNGANTYMQGTPVQWQGTVSFVSWDGAHVMYQLEVRNKDGIVESWQVLGGSPYRLSTRGIFKKTVKAGDTVTVAGYLNTDSRIVTPIFMVPADGHKLFVGYVASDASFTPPVN